MSSASSVIIGDAVNQFLNANTSSLIYFAIVFLILGLLTPVFRLANYMQRELLAQRLERDTRKEFYASLLGKSQSFHDKQKIGELMAPATDDVRMLNHTCNLYLNFLSDTINIRTDNIYNPFSN